MAKFRLGATALGLTVSAIFAAQAFAIGNEAECTVEGGTMVNVKGSDFCLVPIRPEAYADPIYDGNQLGVTECPGNKLNDGLYCMYPVTIRPEPIAEPVAETAEEVIDVEEAVEDAVDAVVDAAEEAAEAAVEDATE